MMLELGVIQANYTKESDGSGNEYPVIHVFGRDTEDNLEHVRVMGFRPYFYAPTAEVKDARLNPDLITGTEDGYQNIRGGRMTKLYSPIPGDVGNVREDFTHYEADILFPDRLLIDKDIKSGIRIPEKRNDAGVLEIEHDEIEPIEMSANMRVHTADIEVDDRRGFPEDGEEEIICITAHDSYRDEYVVWLYVDEDEASAVTMDSIDYDPMSESMDRDIRVFGSEVAMLDDYLDYLEETNPDILTGWNFITFDSMYLIARLDTLNEETDEYIRSERLSRLGEVWDKTDDYGGPTIKGRINYDLLEAYKNNQRTEKESYGLDYIGEHELGVGKEEHEGKVGELWERSPAELVEYNLRDVEICVELNDEQNIIPFWDEVRQFIGCRLGDTLRMGDMVDIYILQKVHGRFVLPSKKTIEGEDFSGAQVFEPVTGVKRNVAVHDLMSLYPMSMATLNASPETKVDGSYDGPTYRAPNGVEFMKEPDGIIREIINELLEERNRKKELRGQHPTGSEKHALYDMQQAAVKVIMVSLYGVMGWDKFRLYDKDVSAAVTATGRETIKFSEEVVNEMGYEVTYGDTDSVMIELGDNLTMPEAINAGYKIEERINQAYDEFAQREFNADENRLEMEFEKLYRTFFQAGTKKRYAGHVVWKEGEQVDSIGITGFEYKRSDNPRLVREVQEKVIQMILYGEEHKVRDYVTEVVSNIESGEVPLEEIGIPSGLGQELENYSSTGGHILAAKMANLLLDTNLGKGSKPKRVYLKRIDQDWLRQKEEELGISQTTHEDYNQFLRYFGAKNKDPAIAFESPEQIPEAMEIDWEKMVDKTVKGPIERVIAGIGIEWDEIQSGQQQTGLGQFA